MDIRSLTVERGFATLARQTHLPTLLSLSSRNSGNNASIEAISSRTGVPAIQESQEEWEPEGDHFDDEESEEPNWFLERRDEVDENKAIRQGDKRTFSRRADDDV